MTVGEMCRMMISKLDWFGTLFPRLPVVVQKNIEGKLQEFQMSCRQVLGVTLVYFGVVIWGCITCRIAAKEKESNGQDGRQDDDASWGEAGRRASGRNSPVR